IGSRQFGRELVFARLTARHLPFRTTCKRGATALRVTWVHMPSPKFVCRIQNARTAGNVIYHWSPANRCTCARRHQMDRLQAPEETSETRVVVWYARSRDVACVVRSAR